MRIGALKLLMFFAFASPFSALAEGPPTNVLFHAGTKTNIEDDIRLKTITPNVWENFIFGKTNFDLPDYRKGLYGAENLSGTSLYYLYKILGGEEPAIMTIHVKPACLTHDALGNAEYVIDDKNPTRFTKWYLRHPEWKSKEELCLHKDWEPYEWETGALYGIQEHDEETQKLTRECTPALDRYLRDEKIKLVFDQVNQDSWYIRDRDCIETITGTPDDFFSALAANQIGNPENDLLTNLYGDSVAPGSFSSGSTLFVAKVFSETSKLKATELDKIVHAVKTYLRNDAPPKHPTLDRNGDNPFILLKLTEAAQNAVSRGTVKNFQTKLQATLQTLRVSLGKICQGKNGVKPERQAACSQETQRQTDLLLKALE